MVILEVKNLTKQFGGVRALNDLSLSIEPAKITGIIGPNGSGKTTLINILSGLITADRGIVIIENTELRKIRPYDALSYGLTRTFQQVRLFNQMSVLDNILVVLTERNVFSAFFEKHTDYHLNRAKETLERVGLWEKKNELAGNLSYGQRKLLEIGRALAEDTDVFLLDESFSGLFPEMAKTISGIIKSLRDDGKTIILMEHDMGLIRNLCDYVFVLDSGSLLAYGKPNEVLAERKVIEAYLGE